MSTLRAHVGSGRRYYWLAHIGLLGIAVGAVRVLAPQPAPTPTPPRAQVLPPPVAVVVPAPVVIAVAPSPPPPRAAPPERAPPPPPVILHTACAADRSAVGVPIAAPDGGVPDAASTAPERRAATSADGCTIATWTSDSLAISWDGGQTFTAYELNEGSAVAVAATAGRVVVLSDELALGVAHTGEPELAWHSADPQRTSVPNQVMAAGRWTVVVLSSDAGAIAALSADDGATWTYAQPPARGAVYSGIDDAGRLIATALHDDGCRTERWSTELAHLDWRRDGIVAGNLVGATASPFSLLPIRTFSCDYGGELVAHHAGRRIALGTATTDDLHIAARGDVAFVSVPFSARIVRIVDGKMSKLPAIDAMVRDIDTSGALLATNADHVFRWSARGGWRILWSPPFEDND